MNPVLTSYLEAKNFIDMELVSPTKRRRAPDEKRATALEFYRRLGDPQRAFPSVQVAGTSGKGSVCSFVASGLRSCGLKTGLHVSPYLQVITEKTWIDGSYCPPWDFHSAVEQVRPLAQEFAGDPNGPASVHGMASLGASFIAFKAARIEAGVIETGLGGRYDLVQGLDKHLAVITDLGLDHLDSLGETIEEIAWHKAGIMEPGLPCLAIRGPGARVLEEEAGRISARLTWLEPEKLLVDRRKDGPAFLVTLLLPSLGKVRLRLPQGAGFPLRNAITAAAVLDQLHALGWGITRDGMVEGLAEMHYPGRFEQLQDGPPIILDGAHNPQKMGALLSSLAERFSPERRFVVVAGFTGGRVPGPLLEQLAPRCSYLIAAAARLHGKEVAAPAQVAAAARQLGIPSHAAESVEEAVDQALEMITDSTGLLVTGSLYLVGQARNRWYPWQQVALQGTSWPSPRP